MDSVRPILAVCFWAAAAGIAYTWVFYPLLLHALARAFGSVPVAPEVPDADLPRVTLLIVAHNEAAVIEDRIRNAVSLDYPGDALDIVIASDGSDDETVALCRRWEPRVRVLAFEERRGKAAALNEAVEHIDSDIVAFSDANTSMHRSALRNLARWFADPRTGSVCGRLVLRDGGGNADGLYWRYETYLKFRESRLGALLGANGAIYAIRRRDFTPLPAGTIVDDFVLPLLARLRGGGRIIYDADAVAHEESAPDLTSEFHRRARIGAGGVQALRTLWPLLSPRAGWTAFALWSHKVLRWACPLLLLAALTTSLALSSEPLYFAALLVQTLFYGLAAAFAALSVRSQLPRPLRVIPIFAGLNLALLVGTVRGVIGQPTGIWRRTRRGVPAQIGNPQGVAPSTAGARPSPCRDPASPSLASFSASQRYDEPLHEPSGLPCVPRGLRPNGPIIAMNGRTTKKVDREMCLEFGAEMARMVDGGSHGGGH